MKKSSVCRNCGWSKGWCKCVKFSPAKGKQAVKKCKGKKKIEKEIELLKIGNKHFVQLTLEIYQSAKNQIEIARKALGQLFNHDLGAEQMSYIAQSAISEMDKCLINPPQALVSLAEELEQIADIHKMIMDEKCPTDEVHCACVPAMVVENKKLVAEIATLRNRRC